MAVGLAILWATEFGWLAVERHLAGGSHAEDLGFADQVVANFVRGQFFRMSIYQGATWNTEIDVSRMARPDSLLAFHFEPMLLLLAPVYAFGGGAVALLVIQAVAVAAGALPAYRLGSCASGSALGGLAVAMAYLLSPLGQWAVLADFHTSTLAAPLLVLAVERLVVKKSALQAVAVAALAATAREDVGLAIATLGVLVLLKPPLPLGSGGRDDSLRTRSLPALALLGVGLSCSILGALTIRSYSSGVSLFDARYGATLGAGFGPSLAAIGRPEVVGYLGALALSGGWLGLLAPWTLVPALPGMALNVLSASPWMAAGKAHYSSLVLAFIAVAAAAGLGALRGRPALVQFGGLALIVTSLAGYVREGAGPLGGNYAPATVTQRAMLAQTLANGLARDASISASSALVPRVSGRPKVYVFPAVLDAEYVFLDLETSPAPTSAGDVFLRVRALLTDGGWSVETAQDGLLLLQRAADAPPTDIHDLSTARAGVASAAGLSDPPLGSFLGGRVSLLSATLLPSPDAAVGVDGPRGVLRIVWRAEQPLPGDTHLDFWVDLQDGERLHVWDVAALWWNPPERWTPGEPVAIDIPDVPMRRFRSWQATWTAHEP